MIGFMAKRTLITVESVSGGSYVAFSSQPGVVVGPLLKAHSIGGAGSLTAVFGLSTQVTDTGKRPMARVALGGAGAVLSLAAGNPIPAALTRAGTLLAWEPQDRRGGAFSYLFEVQRSIR